MPRHSRANKQKDRLLVDPAQATDDAGATPDDRVARRAGKRDANQAILDEAARLIKRARKPQAGLALIDSLPRPVQNHRQAKVLRMTALAMSGGGPEFDALLAEITPENPAYLQEVRKACSFLLDKKRLPVTTLTYEMLWGPKPDDIKTALNRLAHPDGNIPILADLEPGYVRGNATLTLIKTISDITGTPIDRDAYLARYRLGLQYYNYARYLLKCSEPKTDASPIDLESLRTQLNDHVIAPDLTALDAILASDGTIVILQLHGSVNHAIHNAALALSAPRSLISNSVTSGPGSRPGDFNVSSLDPNLPIEFAKLCQLMRKGKRVVQIFSDGGQGGSFATEVIGGCEVKIALGAAALAYYGKSTLVFAHTSWTDDGIAVDFSMGPKVDIGDTKAIAERKLIDFTKASIITLLSGDPVNFAKNHFMQNFMGRRNT